MAIEPSKPQPTLEKTRRPWLVSSTGMAMVISLAGAMGLQLGSDRWRYRRQWWQLQGCAAGCGAGLLVGYISGRASEGSRGGN